MKNSIILLFLFITNYVDSQTLNGYLNRVRRTRQIQNEQNNQTQQNQQSQQLKDVTNVIDNVIYRIKTDCQAINNQSWISEDIIYQDFMMCTNNGQTSIASYYGGFNNLNSVQRIKNKLNYIKENFRAGGTYDIKDTKYGALASFYTRDANNNIVNDWVTYNGKAFRIQDLGNITYGIAIKMLLFPQVVGTCGGGVYQSWTDLRANVKNYLDARLKGEFQNFEDKLIRTLNEDRGICLDHLRDSYYIQMGYKWF